MDFYENRWRPYRKVFVINEYQFVGTRYMKKSDGSYFWTGGVALDPSNPIRAAAELRISPTGQKRLDVFPPNGKTITVNASRPGQKVSNSKDIDLTPTEEMAANAARGLELRRKHGKGGTAIGVARARDISNRKNLSPETVRRMHAFFSRHEKNKAGGEDDAGYIAWLLWGGDSGQSWAKRKVEQMEKETNEMSETYKTIAQRLGSAARNDRPGAKARMGKASDALNYIKSSIASGKTVYVSAGHHITKVTPEAYAKWEASGRPLFKLGSKGSLLMASGSSYIALSMGDDIMLAGIKAFSRPGAKAKMAKVDRARVLRELRALRDNAKAERNREAERLASMYLAELNRANTTEEDWEEADMATSKILEVLHGEYSRPGEKARMGANENRVRAAGYKWQVRYTKQLGKTEYLGGPPQVIEDTVYFATESNARDWANTMLGKGWFKGMGGSPEKVLTAKVLMFSRPGAKAKFATTHEDLIAELRALTQGKHTGEWHTIANTWLSRKRATGNLEIATEANRAYDLVEREMLARMKSSRPGAKVANAVREGEKVSAADDAVSRKIRKLMDEGKPQKQAVAIALDLERRGEL